jgi:hypothetical protein
VQIPGFTGKLHSTNKVNGLFIASQLIAMNAAAPEGAIPRRIDAQKLI